MRFWQIIKSTRSRPDLDLDDTFRDVGLDRVVPGRPSLPKVKSPGKL